MPDGLDTFAEVVENMTALDATTSGEEAADDAGNMAADIEILGIIDTDALHTQAEATNARQHNGLPFTQFLLHSIL